MTLSSADVTRMRATAEMTLTQTCTLYRNTISTDGEGGWSESSEASIGTDVACRLAVHTTLADLTERRGRLSAYHEYVLKLKYSQAVEPNDEVVISNVRYRVEAVLDEHQWLILKRCVLSRIQ